MLEESDGLLLPRLGVLGGSIVTTSDRTENRKDVVSLERGSERKAARWKGQPTAGHVILRSTTSSTLDSAFGMTLTL